MIRGTNKRIIEISGEDGSCFERIVLFVRPEQDEQDEEKMLKLAEDYADGFMKTRSAPALMVRPRHTVKGRVWAFLAAAAGVLGVVALGVLLAISA